MAAAKIAKKALKARKAAWSKFTRQINDPIKAKEKRKLQIKRSEASWAKFARQNEDPDTTAAVYKQFKDPALRRKARRKSNASFLEASEKAKEKYIYASKKAKAKSDYIKAYKKRYDEPELVIYYI